MLWVWLVSMPVVFVNSRTTQPDLGPLDYAGLAIFGETLALPCLADTVTR
jgi:steroid 5-alpha reductase family enzyme